MDADIRRIIREELENFFSEKEVSKTDAAKKLKVSRTTVYRRIRAGKLQLTNSKKIDIKSIAIKV